VKSGVDSLMKPKVPGAPPTPIGDNQTAGASGTFNLPPMGVPNLSGGGAGAPMNPAAAMNPFAGKKGGATVTQGPSYTAHSQ